MITINQVLTFTQAYSHINAGASFPCTNVTSDHITLGYITLRTSEIQSLLDNNMVIITDREYQPSSVKGHVINFMAVHDQAQPLLAVPFYREDFQQFSNINDEKLAALIKQMRKNHDASIGINWDSIQDAMNEL